MMHHFVYVKTEHLGIHPRTKLETLLPVGLIVRHGYEEFVYCEAPNYGIFVRTIYLSPDIDEKDWYYNEATEEVQENPI